MREPALRISSKMAGFKFFGKFGDLRILARYESPHSRLC